ncbi:hypothetical protein GVN21_07495 [Caulobacter sp. SLTY]|uniref:hypothetical protein n=1 Tax=Caulobacter sp. SLTY TaxID=2683262 RepID=UPI001412C9A0|nr:hypothetical protein [Caulobacter sp. SLTY]NBB15198.1 hypothetical protein [Caulobacter sp. SLTY]
MTTAVHQDQEAMPAAYAVFAPVLERLSAPMQQVLGGLLAQFERGLNRYDPPRARPQGEFEGLGGLARSGDIGHVLQSELLLRTEAPLEFLRRLADGETLFLEKQYADPGARPVYRAMVSVGPGALGHGRILSLAALFYLARIAGQRGADFHWCFLPREDGAVWFEGLTVNGVKRLLKAASYRELDAADQEEAMALWSRLSGEPVEVADWVIGARPRRHITGRPAAVDVAANAFGFILGPPIPSASRSMTLAMRLAGQPRPGLELTFPDDRVCVSALREPFAPVSPLALPPPETAPAIARTGWAPTGMASAHGRARIVRLEEGLLILEFSNDSELKSSWLLRMPPGAVLAGIRYDQSRINVLLYREVSGQGQLAFGSFFLHEYANLAPFEKVRHAVPAGQLFKRHPPDAIPPLLVTGRTVRFYSFGGGVYDLMLDGQGLDVFKPRREAPKIVGSDGFHHVYLEEGTPARFVVKKHDQLMYHHFRHGQHAVQPDRLLGLCHQPSEQALAYSQAPQRWVIAPHLPHQQTEAAPEAVEVKLEAGDRLLAGRWRPQGAQVRIWSDARHGGKGTIRSAQVRDGVLGRPQHEVKLGRDAGRMTHLEIGYHGYWGLVVGEDGKLAELLYLRPNRKTSSLARTAWNLRDLAREAKAFDLGRILD